MKYAFYFLITSYLFITGYQALINVYKFHSPYSDIKIGRVRTRKRTTHPFKSGKVTSSPQPAI